MYGYPSGGYNGIKDSFGSHVWNRYATISIQAAGLFSEAGSGGDPGFPVKRSLASGVSEDAMPTPPRKKLKAASGRSRSLRPVLARKRTTKNSAKKIKKAETKKSVTGLRKHSPSGVGRKIRRKVRGKIPRRGVRQLKSIRIAHHPSLTRHPENPILSPLEEHPWEKHQTFNAAALSDENGKVHLIYRSIGHDGLSRFGYASSSNGLDIDERSSEPVFSPALEPDSVPVLASYASGGSWGGAEDPRLTAMEGKIFMLYTGFDRGGFPRVALASIDRKDFLNHKWKWSRVKFISPPGEIHKNWVLFPEKIRGKYAILHSMSPTVDIEYLDNLDFEAAPFIDSPQYHRPDVPVRGGTWERGIRGPGPTPLKTKYGWLVFYHATTDDCGYNLGAMLLDLDDPSRIVARAAEPVLEPEAWYETEGVKGNIVYSCGAVIIGRDLIVYYGGADSVLCVAKTDLDKFLQSLIGNAKPPKLKTSKK